MPRRIVVINGHPDPDASRFCYALADRYAAGARASGHAVSIIKIATLHFDLVRTAAEFERDQPTPDIVDAQAAIGDADHIVFIYPLWLGTMPALLKAFLECTFRPGFAFGRDRNPFDEKKLKGKSARVVITMGMPSLIYRWFYFAHSLRSFERNILKFVGISPVRTTVFGSIAKMSPDKAESFLANMQMLGARGL